MLFNSAIFLLIFLPFSLIGWYSIKNLKGRLLFLTAVSSVFYGYWDVRFVFLMYFSICLDFFCGWMIFNSAKENDRKARRWVALSIVANLCILGFFKYFNFFVSSIYNVLPIDPSSRPMLNIILPVGISFYIFESMTYSVDIYRGIAKPAASILHLSTYISMFPRLNAGPIARYSFIEDQLRNIKSKVDYHVLAHGIFIFTLGLFRKIFIADHFAAWSDQFFNLKVPHQFFVSWGGTLCYAFQIYFDFSGYCEMAYGLGLMLGFEFPKNFNSPYKASSFSDFWRRWNITLSEFLRDYLYIPLGGNRTTTFMTYRNLFITMLLGGLWHGASWMFVIWGALHGLYLVVERLMKNLIDLSKYKLYRAVVFICVCLAWIFFRSHDLHFAIHTFKSCLMLNGFESFASSRTFFHVAVPQFLSYIGGIKNLLALIGAILFVNLAPNVFQLKFKPVAMYAIVTAVLFFMCLLNIEIPSPFIYFQF